MAVWVGDGTRAPRRDPKNPTFGKTRPDVRFRLVVWNNWERVSSAPIFVPADQHNKYKTLWFNDILSNAINDRGGVGEENEIRIINNQTTALIIVWTAAAFAFLIMMMLVVRVSFLAKTFL